MWQRSIIEKSSFLLALIVVSIGFSLSDSCIHANTKLLCAQWMSCYWITWSTFGVLEVGLGAGVRCQAYHWTIILKISWQWKQSLDDRCVSDSWLATGSPLSSPILQGQRTPKPLVLLSLLACKQTFAQPENSPLSAHQYLLCYQCHKHRKWVYILFANMFQVPTILETLCRYFMIGVRMKKQKRQRQLCFMAA